MLAGSDRPLIVTSGSLVVAPGRIATEDDAASANSPRKSEEGSARVGVARRAGVRRAVCSVGPWERGSWLRPRLIAIAREKGISAYVGDGLNRWPGVHRLDAAHLYRLALEKGLTGERYHGVADEGVPAREIAEVIGRRLNVPVVSKSSEQAAAHFGWIGQSFAIDGPASSARTQARLGWWPTQPGLLADLDANYFEQAELAAVLQR